MSAASPAGAPVPPFHLFRDLLDPQSLARLVEWTLASEALFEPSRIGGRGYDPSARRCTSFTASAPNPWYDVLAKRVRAMAPELFDRLGMKPVAVAHCELELTAYNDGAFFHPHIDTVTGAQRGESDRILSGVYYFYREPKGFEGGELRLFPFGPGPAPEGAVDVAPLQNALLFFPSWARHEVRPVTCASGAFADSRFAINCWLHGRR